MISPAWTFSACTLRKPSTTCQFKHWVLAKATWKEPGVEELVACSTVGYWVSPRLRSGLVEVGLQQLSGAVNGTDWVFPDHKVECGGGRSRVRERLGLAGEGAANVRGVRGPEEDRAEPSRQRRAWATEEETKTSELNRAWWCERERRLRAVWLALLTYKFEVCVALLR